MTMAKEINDPIGELTPWSCKSSLAGSESPRDKSDGTSHRLVRLGSPGENRNG
jgi:hypothetical protein